MIASMTAYAEKTTVSAWGTLTWEIRSVNHRYLELSVRLPDFLRQLEQSVRERLQQDLHRGKVEALLRFQPGENSPFDMTINQQLINQLAAAINHIAHHFPNFPNTTTIDAVGLLAWPGVVQTKEVSRSAMHDAVLQLLTETTKDLLLCRMREGGSMADYLKERLMTLHTQLRLIEQRAPAALSYARQKIKSRLEEIAASLDQDRLEQEMVWLAQKADVAEECQRTKTHLAEVERILIQGGVVGRRLDFLMQELNRESNTLGSKSIDAEMTQAVVEMKVQIEQMREQVQNIE